MKILITGASGQDGILLIDHIFQNSPDVTIYALSRSPQKFSNHLHAIGGLQLAETFHQKGHFIICDVTDRAKVMSQLDLIKPDVIFHLAAHMEPLLQPGNESRVLSRNMNGLIHILEACDQLQIFPHIINAGSSLMFGRVDSGIASEKTPFQPLTPYGLGKVAAHQFAHIFRTYKNQNVSTAILFNHESFLRDERWLPMKIISSSVRIKFGHQDRLKLGSVDSSRDWSSAKDIVSALYAIMDNGALNQDFVLGSGFTMQVSDLLEIAFKRLGLRWQDYVDVEKSEGRVNDILGFSADITKARKEINWEPRIEPKEWVSEIQDFYLEKIERKL